MKKATKMYRLVQEAFDSHVHPVDFYDENMIDNIRYFKTFVQAKKALKSYLTGMLREYKEALKHLDENCVR